MYLFLQRSRGVRMWCSCTVYLVSLDGLVFKKYFFLIQGGQLHSLTCLEMYVHMRTVGLEPRKYFLARFGCLELGKASPP